MQDNAEEVIVKTLGDSLPDRGAKPGSLYSSIMPLKQQRQLPTSDASTEVLVPFLANRKGSQLLANARFVVLLAVATIVVAFVVLRCASKLGMRKWKRGSLRSLAAGGEQSTSSACSFASADTCQHSCDAEGGLGEAELLRRASSVLLTISYVVESNEPLLLRLGAVQRHRAMCLLVSMAIVEFSALKAVTEAHLESVLDCVTWKVAWTTTRLSLSTPRSGIRRAQFKYYTFVLTLRKLATSGAYASLLGRKQRLERLHDLVLLQERALKHVQQILVSIDNMNRVDRVKYKNDLDSSLDLLTGLVYTRKNQVFRDPFLRCWLLENEDFWLQSPIIPNAYLRYILVQKQKSYSEMVMELESPEQLIAAIKRGPQVSRSAAQSDDTETEAPFSFHLADNPSQSTGYFETFSHPGEGGPLHLPEETLQIRTAQAEMFGLGTPFSIPDHRAFMENVTKVSEKWPSHTAFNGPGQFAQQTGYSVLQGFRQPTKFDDESAMSSSVWPSFAVGGATPAEPLVAGYPDFRHPAPPMLMLDPSLGPLHAPAMHASELTQPPVPPMTIRAPGAHRSLREFQGVAVGEPEEGSEPQQDL
ncbi:hypothetical protein, conserved [Eimeria tenella]|uniref:Uncharacterized protein n=1 Tax=Eimeria tenella TaxID=5802 RepID=U6KWD8_EIMTE|nr:hypothetical protein, conserved [Eimeria tenella]CDJ41243.1 hypothetical protein, conserved [Eimeria tenella]|eukprot:XP_013231993.1 hypothetical protein, conserved [Eimeria tenella]